MIYDTFLFYNELELLEIRLAELADVVDRFVLLEADRTFTNRPKPLFFRENRRRFAPFLDRIIHIEMRGYDDVDTGNPWAMERYLRQRLVLGLAECRDDDAILLSDADEIPRASVVAEQAHTPGIKSFVQQESYYFVNCLGSYIVGTTMFPGRFLRHVTRDLQYYRGIRRHMVSRGGWHFSYTGGVKAIQDKLAAFAHTECNQPMFNDPEHLATCLAEARDLFFRIGCEYRVVPLDERFPRYLRENAARFAHLIKPVDSGVPQPSAAASAKAQPVVVSGV